MTIHSDWQIQGEDRTHRRGQPPAHIIDTTPNDEELRLLLESKAKLVNKVPTPPAGVGSNF